MSRARFIGWRNAYECMGTLRHNICVFSLADVPTLAHRLEFFANKFLLDYDPLAYQCMEEWLDSKVSLTQTVDVLNYCRLAFLLPYTAHPACAGLGRP